MPKTVIGIQARSGSTRLKHKSLQLIGSKSILEHCYDTCLQAGVDVYVLPPFDDDVMIEFCRSKNLDFLLVHGEENDVLARYLQMEAFTCADRIVRITGDCPFPNLPLLDWMIRNANAVDFISNTFAPRNVPDGWDIEIMSPDALIWLGENSTDANREHVTQAIYQQEDKYLSDGLSLCKVCYPIDLSGVKVCVDTEQDLQRMRGMYRP